MYVILTNHVNWHRENLWSDRENTGNLKIQFEWVPCIEYSYCVTKNPFFRPFPTAGDHRVHPYLVILRLHLPHGVHLLAAHRHHRLLRRLLLHPQDLQRHQDRLICHRRPAGAHFVQIRMGFVQRTKTKTFFLGTFLSLRNTVFGIN